LDEEGRDEDGYWHENDLEESSVFKVDEPGEYYIEVTLDEATVQSLPVTVTVEEGVWLSRYFIIYGSSARF